MKNRTSRGHDPRVCARCRIATYATLILAIVALVLFALAIQAHADTLPIVITTPSPAVTDDVLMLNGLIPPAPALSSTGLDRLALIIAGSVFAVASGVSLIIASHFTHRN